MFGMFGVVHLAEEAELLQAYGHEGGRHGEVGADVLLALQRFLDLGEPLLVVVEVFFVVDGDALLRPGTPLTKSGAMYAGQLEMRSGAGSRFVRSDSPAVVRTTGGQEGRTEDGRRRGGSTAAHEAPPRGAVGGEAGEKPGIDFVGHSESAFRGFREKRDGVDGGPSRVVEHLLEILGGGNVGGRKHE